MTAFHRPPRLREVAEPVEFALPTPPTPPRRFPRTSLGQVLLIALLPSLLPPVILATVTYMAGAATSTVITSAALGGSLGIAIVVTTLLSRRDEDNRIRAEDREYAAARAAFEADLAARVAEGRHLVEREARVLAWQFREPARLAGEAIALAPTLWERRPADPDFIELRLGAGRRQSCLRFRQDGAAASAEPLIRAAVSELARHGSAPITASFAAGTRAGVFGEPAMVSGLLGSLIIQAAAQHSPTELGIAVFSRDFALCGWAKWLPHCRITSRHETVTLVGRAGEEAAPALRAIRTDIAGRGDAAGRPYLVVADDRSWERLQAYMERHLPLDSPLLTIVRVQDRFEQLPEDCSFAIDLSQPQGRLLRQIEPGEAPMFTLDTLHARQAVEAALALAPVTLGDERSSRAVPASSRLADLLGEGAMEAGATAATWEQSRRAFRLAAPIGMGPGDQAVEIDLRRDGPHGLLAGTTGSGKSEFLQSLVVSFASRIPPDLLNFLLFDYKGGAAFAEVAALPHVVGVVTDLDERLAERALVSLRAELKRREQLLADERAPNITEYQSRPRRVPLANLVIVIDEFHRLVSEQPEFIEQMVQIAQQGRSAGVHLLLSTQKPSGVVTDQIRANTALRICLRVTDEADSRDVLGTPEAAHIPRDLPGRAYIRVGNEALRVCQTGRVSGKVTAPRQHGAGVEADLFFPPGRGRRVRLGGLEVTARPSQPELREDDREEPQETVDERERIVAAICEAGTGYPAQQSPWKAPLPRVIPLADLDRFPARNLAAIAIGLLDEPELLSQGPFEVDLAAGHVLVAGSGNAGKTTGLLTIAGAAARAQAPSDLHIYGIDFAGGDLAALAALPHCGGVAGQQDPPRVQWVLQALRDVMDERLARRSSGGDEAAPRVLVLIDNFVAFQNAVQNAEGGQEAADSLFDVMDVGRSAGITFAITTERPEALRANIMALMHTRLALPMTGSEGYSTLGVPRVTRTAEPIAGRALLPGHVPHEVQLAVDERFAAWDGRPPERLDDGPTSIEPLPASVSYEAVLARAKGSGDFPAGLVLGLREGTKPIFIRPAAEHLLVLGSRGSGRSTALAVAVSELRRNGVSEILVGNPRRAAVLREEAQDATAYAERGQQLGEFWARVTAAWEERSARLRDEAEPAYEPLAIVIDDAELAEIPFDAVSALEQLALQGPDVGVILVVSASTTSLRANYPQGFMRAMLNLRAGLLLVPEATEDFEFFNVRGRPGRSGPGRGWWCESGGKLAVQVARRG